MNKSIAQHANPRNELQSKWPCREPRRGQLKLSNHIAATNEIFLHKEFPHVALFIHSEACSGDRDDKKELAVHLR